MKILSTWTIQTKSDKQGGYQGMRVSCAEEEKEKGVLKVAKEFASMRMLMKVGTVRCFVEAMAVMVLFGRFCW